MISYFLTVSGDGEQAFRGEMLHMDEMSSIISENIKKIRKERKLSLDNVSELTSVSKSMLGQIERGESSPTIATLWKIATGLRISFTSLVEEPVTGTKVIKKEEISPLLNDEGRFRLYPVFPYEEGRGFEMLYIEMDEGVSSVSVPHADGTEEFVIVYEGILSLTVDEEEYIIESGNSIRYMADKTHTYKNAYEGQTRICMLIYYRK